MSNLLYYLFNHPNNGDDIHHVMLGETVSGHKYFKGMYQIHLQSEVFQDGGNTFF
jgi:hypothetical protein